MKKIKLIEKKDIIAILLLLSIFLFHFINNTVYLAIDTEPVAWDNAWHSTTSLSYYNELTGNGEPDISKFSLDLSGRSSMYPHLFHISSLPIYLFFGFSDDTAASTNLIYFFILILFTYLLAKDLCGRKAGILASFIVGMYPVVFGMSRIYEIDFAIMGLIVAALYYLIKFKNTEKVIYAFLFIFVSILGIFTKQAFALFVFPSALYVLILKLYEFYKKTKIKKSFLWLVFFLVGIVLVCLGYFYLKYSSGFYLFSVLKWNALRAKPIITLQRLSACIISNLSLVYLLLFLFSLFFWKKIKEKIIFSLWIFLPLALFMTAGWFADGRYLMPAYTAVAIISSLTIFSIENKVLKKILIAGLLFFSIFQYLDISYNPIKSEITLGSFTFYKNEIRMGENIITNAKEENWRINEFLDFMEKISGGKNITISIRNLNMRYFNPKNVAYYNYKKNYRNIKILENYKNPDYTVAPYTIPGDSGKLSQVKDFLLPNGVDVLVFKNLTGLK